jgi:hypothetical protein
MVVIGYLLFRGNRRKAAVGRVELRTLFAVSGALLPPTFLPITRIVFPVLAFFVMIAACGDPSLMTQAYILTLAFQIVTMTSLLEQG